MLAGCAGGSGSAPSEAATGDLRSGSSARTPRKRPATTSRRRSRTRTPAGPSPIEEQTWAGLVDKLTTPPVARTTAPTSSRSATRRRPASPPPVLFLDISDIQDALGGDDLLPGLRGGRHLRRRVLRAAATTPVPASCSTPRRSSATRCRRRSTSTSPQGIAAARPTRSRASTSPGKDWYNALPYIWENGGEIAVQDGDEWDAQFSSDDSVAGLEQVQDVILNASVAPKDGDERLGNIDFCAGEVGFLSSSAGPPATSPVTGRGATRPPAKRSRGLPRHRLGPAAFALPGMKAGETAQVFAGGSNIAIATKATPRQGEDRARDHALARGTRRSRRAGPDPRDRSRRREFLPDTPIAKAQAEAPRTRSSPRRSPNWAEVEAAQIILDALRARSHRAAMSRRSPTEVDTQIEAILNE